MKVSKENIIHLANLARLKFNENEVEKFAEQMQGIIEFANKLDEVDVSGVEPTNHILPIKNVFRKDEEKPSFDRDILFQNAPTKEQGCISVPKVME